MFPAVAKPQLLEQPHLPIPLAPTTGQGKEIHHPEKLELGTR
jgi:hypothetical protein